MNLILYLGLILLAGWGIGALFNRIKVPSVTGYLVVGLILGPSILNLVSQNTLEVLTPVNAIALSLIAFLIGGELSFKELSKCGRSVLWITCCQVMGALLFTSLALYLFAGLELYVAMLFGTIASATAPAATVMVVRECKAKGQFTDTLLKVVAIDDALCIMVYGLIAATARVVYGGAGGGVSHLIFRALWELTGSLVLGVIFGMVLLVAMRRLKGESDRLVVLLGFLFFQSGLASMLNLSPLLAGMAMGCFATNFAPYATEKLFTMLEAIDAPIYVLFFVVAGANLQLGLLSQLGMVGVIYVISRLLGKVLGAGIGGKIGQASPLIQKYLGLGLIPQAGVAIGLTLLVQNDFPKIASLVTTVVLGSVIVNEIIGPFLTRIALTKSGEMGRS